MSHTEEFNRIMEANKPAKKAKKVMPTNIDPRDNMTELQADLCKCTYTDNVIFLPRPSECKLKNYDQVRKAMLNAGASYRSNTFVFPNDAKPYIDRLMGGESVNIKKEFQFFATPAPLAAYLVSLADIDTGMSILEPSAGQGAIIHAINEGRGVNDTVYYCELMDVNRTVLQKIKNTMLVEDDFLKMDIKSDFLQFDRVIANPPFNKNQDIDHIRKMYEVCKVGGRVVTIASNSWRTGSQKKQVEFRTWLDSLDSEIMEIPHGAFKESGTNVSSCIIIINK